MTSIAGGPQDLRLTSLPQTNVSTYQLVLNPRVTFVPDPIESGAIQAIQEAVAAATETHALQATVQNPDLWIICYREEAERLRAPESEVRVDVSVDQQHAFTYRYPFPSSARYGPHLRGNLIIDIVNAQGQLVTQAADLSFFDHQWQIGLTGRGQLDASPIVQLALANALSTTP